MSGFALGTPVAIGGQAGNNPTANTIADFLTRVLPPNPGQGRAIGIHYARRNPEEAAKAAAAGKKYSPAIPGRAFHDVASAARYAAGYVFRMQQNTMDSDLYACMSLCGMEVLDTRSTPHKLRATRNRQVAVGCKALWCDLDILGGDKKDGYPSQQDACNHLDSLIAAGSVPPTTLRVSSGNGVHAYWVLDRELTRDQWYALGPVWSQYLTKLGVKHDQNVASDVVRVLRLPGTYNVKDPNNVLPTAIMGAIDPVDIPVATFENLLGVSTANAPVNPIPAPAAAPALPPMGGALATVATSNFRLPDAFNNVTPLAPVPAGPSEFSGGITAEHVGQPVNFAQVVANCPTLSDIKNRGGAGDSGVLWGLAILAATFAPASEGLQWAHDFGNKHALYSIADTDAKFAEKVNARQASGNRIGWPSCRAFSQASAACAACPRLQQGKSPFHGMRDDSDMPEGYVRENGQIVTFEAQDELGNTQKVVVLPYGIMDAYMEMTVHGPALNAEIVHIKNPPKRLQLLVGAATAWKDEAIKTLGAIGVALMPHQIPLARSFFVSYIQMLQARVADVAARDGFGWTTTRENKVGFAYGGRVYAEDGSSEIAPNADRTLSTQFSQRGTLAEWKQAADLVMGMGRTDLQVLVATAFAGPLIHYSGQTGVVVSAYSPETGAQKSSAMKVALSVWGDPVKGMSRLDDTINHVGKKLGQLRHLPVYWDELTRREHAERFADLGFALTLGTEKGRMGSDTNLREAGSWATMLVVASNPGLRQVMLDGAAANSGAGVSRMLEIEIAKVPLQSSAAAAGAIIEQTHHNFGIVGALYAETLARESSKLKARLQTVSEALEKATNSHPDERFWILAGATILLGAALANTLRDPQGQPIIRFDLGVMRAFIIKAIIGQRQARQSDVVDFGSEDFAVSVVQGYLNHCRSRGECLDTDTAPAGAGRPKLVAIRMLPEAAQRLRVAQAHVVQDDEFIRFREGPFRDWVTQEKKWPFDIVKRCLEKYGSLSRPRAKWAGGTPWAGVIEHFYVIDVGTTRTPLGKRFELKPPAQTPTPATPPTP